MPRTLSRGHSMRNQLMTRPAHATQATNQKLLSHHTTKKICTQQECSYSCSCCVLCNILLHCISLQFGLSLWKDPEAIHFAIANATLKRQPYSQGVATKV